MPTLLAEGRGRGWLTPCTSVMLRSLPQQAPAAREATGRGTQVVPDGRTQVEGARSRMARLPWLPCTVSSSQTGPRGTAFPACPRSSRQQPTRTPSMRKQFNWARWGCWDRLQVYISHRLEPPARRQMWSSCWPSLPPLQPSTPEPPHLPQSVPGQIWVPPKEKVFGNGKEKHIQLERKKAPGRKGGTNPGVHRR